MIINTNVAGLNTFNALNKNTSAMNRAWRSCPRARRSTRPLTILPA